MILSILLNMMLMVMMVKKTAMLTAKAKSSGMQMSRLVLLLKAKATYVKMPM